MDLKLELDKLEEERKNFEQDINTKKWQIAELKRKEIEEKYIGKIIRHVEGDNLYLVKEVKICFFDTIELKTVDFLFSSNESFVVCEGFGNIYNFKEERYRFCTICELEILENSIKSILYDIQSSK